MEKSEFKNYQGYNNQYGSLRDLMAVPQERDTLRSTNSLMTISRLDFSKALN